MIIKWLTKYIGVVIKESFFVRREMLFKTIKPIALTLQTTRILISKTCISIKQSLPNNLARRNTLIWLIITYTFTSNRLIMTRTIQYATARWILL